MAIARIFVLSPDGRSSSAPVEQYSEEALNEAMAGASVINPTPSHGYMVMIADRAKADWPTAFIAEANITWNSETDEEQLEDFAETAMIWMWAMENAEVNDDD
jgi:hypothetical protein